MWIFSFWVDCFKTQGGKGSAKIWWRAHPPVTQAGSTLLLFAVTHFLKGVLKELWGVSRAKVIQGRRGCYSTELVGTYWHSIHKEIGKNGGQGFTLGSPDISFAVRGCFCWFFIHSPGASPEGKYWHSFSETCPLQTELEENLARASKFA